MANKHTAADLAQLQSMPLEMKIRATKQRIEQWYEYWDGMVYVSFSGGKDSTVLKHIVDSMYDDVPAVFVNTGLEYPEIQKFAMSQPNVITIRPKMRFDEVIKEYGYPIIGKTVAHNVKVAKRNPNGAVMKNVFNPEKHGPYAMHKWSFLFNAPFDIGERCCDVMKKNPVHAYERETGRVGIVGTMADESRMRYDMWLKHGCNAFDAQKPKSSPLSFWTEQDILEYIDTYKISYASVYGDIKKVNGNYSTTGCERTGCIFCGFGAHLEKEPNRFQRLKDTHPKQWSYCIAGGGGTI